MKIYEKTKPPYIETDVSGVGLGVTLLHTRSNTSCHKGEAPANSILRPTAFVSKSLAEAEKNYSNIKRESLGILYGLKNSTLLLHKR